MQLSRKSRRPMLTATIIPDTTIYVLEIVVVTKLPKRNKFSLPYDPVPYKVVNTKGSMVSTEKLTGDKLLTRNSSHFKKIVIH